MMDEAAVKTGLRKSCMEHLWWYIPPTAHLHLPPTPPTPLNFCCSMKQNLGSYSRFEKMTDYLQNPLLT